MSTSYSKRKKIDVAGQGPAPFDQLEALRVLAEDAEAVYDYGPSSGPSSSINGEKHAEIMGYRPTPKAFLAKRGFLLQQSLGSGTYSKVKLALKYKIKKTGLDEPSRVAVKIVDKHRAPNDYLTKFLPREVNIWPTLNHPYIAPLLEIMQDGRNIYMVMPYAPGGDALTYVQNDGALCEQAALRWMRQVIDAVSYLHGRGIAHRDLKLENLLIDENGELVLCDFGFTRGDCGLKSDLSSTFCGSKSYASPEILNARPYDPCKADVWALGVITYILISGKMPFDEARGTRYILNQQKHRHFRWADSPHTVSDNCRDFILSTFTWDFHQRPSIKDVLDDPWLADNTQVWPLSRCSSAMETASHAYHGHGDCD